MPVSFSNAGNNQLAMSPSPGWEEAAAHSVHDNIAHKEARDLSIGHGPYCCYFFGERDYPPALLCPDIKIMALVKQGQYGRIECS
jgi:hypothetical protein